MKLSKLLKSMGAITIMSISLYGCSSEGSDYSPQQIIQNSMTDSKKIIPYYAESVMKSNDGVGELVIKEWVAKDGKRRVETIDKKNGDKSISVNDGEKVTTFNETTNTAYSLNMKGEALPVQMSPKEQAQALLNAIKDTHTVKLVGEEKLLNRDVYHIKAEAKEKGSLIGDQEIWVDKGTWFVLKSISNSAGSQASVEYKKIDFEPSFNDSLFKIDLPKDVKIENVDNTMKENEVKSLDEAKALVNKPFLYVKEQGSITIGKMSVIQIDKKTRPEVTIQYLKEGLPYFSLTVFPINEKNEPFNKDGENIRGFKGEKTNLKGFRSFNWAEDGIGYSVILENPDLSFEQMKDLITRMEYVK